MTPQQINIKIAEKCGWKIETGTEIDGPCGKEDINWTTFTKDGIEQGCPSDYYHDLNLCAEFEQTITETEKIEYGRRLADQLKGVMGHYGFFIVATSTSPQRCEAFLRLHGLWENVK